MAGQDAHGNDGQGPAPVTLIAGATASGKSALALRMAAAHDGIIVNADSMQVYADLRILTARPSPEDEARVAHRLYGHVPGATAYSVARWLAEAAAEIDAAREAGRPVFVVGGTGLYFKALLEGLSPIPPIPEDVRAHWRGEGAAHGAEALHGALALRDPETAARLAPSDLQRVVRALEVLDATGRPLCEWQRKRGTPVVEPEAASCLLISRPRADLYAACDRRLEAMVRDGALDEAARLAALGLDPDLLVMRALGVAPLIAHVRGKMALEQALAAAQRETRQYVKRQLTWQRRYMIAWKSV